MRSVLNFCFQPFGIDGEIGVNGGSDVCAVPATGAPRQKEHFLIREYNLILYVFYFITFSNIS